MLCAEIHRELLAEETVEVLAREPYFIRARDKNLILVVGVGEDTFEAWHLLGIEFRPYLVSHEKKLRARVVHYIVNLLGMELMQDRHCHGTIRQRSHESNAPTGCVAAADGHLVTMLDAGGFEDNMQFLNDAGYIFVLVGVGAIVCHRRQIPVVVNTLLNTSIKTWTFHLRSLLV